MDWFDELNSAFKARKRTEEEEAWQRAAAENEGAGKAARLMKALILPVIQEYSDHIRRQGQTSEVRERFRPKGSSLEFLFGPWPADDSLKRQSSILRFVDAGDGWFSIEKEIRSAQNTPSYSTSPRRWQVTEISENFIRTEAKAFIAAVFDVH